MSKLEIADLETAGELHDRLAIDGAPLMLQALDQLAKGTATETPQDESQATKAPKLSREASKVDWSHPADQIARQIRGMYPWPGCRVRLLDASGAQIGRLTLLRARASSTRRESAAPGSILLDGTIACGNDSALDLMRTPRSFWPTVQPEGKRPMPLADFCNGHPWHAGMRLEPLT
jgi:methionyl-tRNA formyltransferase